KLQSGGDTSGVMNYDSSAGVEVAGGTFTIDSGATFPNTGVLQIDSGAQLTVTTSLTLPIVLASGTIDVENNSYVTLGWPSTLSNATLTVDSGSTLDLTGGNSVNVSGTLSGSGAGTVLFSGGTM